MDARQTSNLVDDQSAGIERLLEIMRRLRDPDTGCPWDIKQTFKTIASYTIEEAYEVADAVERSDWNDLEGELGDLLLQSVYHATIGEEAGYFTFQTIITNISNKMIARHPHVFGSESREKSVEQQIDDWENIKAEERSTKKHIGVLDGIASNLPALSRALKLQKRAARVGFDWPNTDHVLAKISEESAELIEARETLNKDNMIDEMGDLLFVIANLSRHLNIDPEEALRRTNAKFVRRFNSIEYALSQMGKKPEDSSLEEMDDLWNDAKMVEKEKQK
ncbi:MAG: nucleoside triphosphate pyrophosphohydrolase [Tateyamaria sp.]|jgi:ATP diphosphatase|nr:nucleoside triphosphate pyrophosphohydrolase [Tateyamaria sp.]MBT5302298.1 nucleoside triphosphate pyrophosphohydrolase [Tateyamaria sp.]MBT6266730.1 nucleoside triphosphate pyrophosphohydrolase [Tateyamaria sp.]MBT6341921.1 nucleoside triphosphate pyrophosphohydrolase [Tateyamaria sp.]MBT7448973.1 nucleoside triphosphate pyrophosphohydrolase [Tateyamaria sp.]